jgi:hypothetical protein
MLPIYQNYLSFNDEMIAIILALNVMLDNVITSVNVMGNGGLARVFENIWRFRHHSSVKIRHDNRPI